MKLSTRKLSTRIFILLSMFFLAYMVTLIMPLGEDDIVDDGNTETYIGVCEDSLIKRIVYAYDKKDIDGIVIDYYIDEKELSEFYGDKLCEDLLKVRLNETLNKSKNFLLDIYSSIIFVTPKGIKELDCGYRIFWDNVDGNYYGQIIDEGVIIFGIEETLLAYENRPPKYNESLVSVRVNEDYRQTALRNGNGDYDVILGLKLNMSGEYC